MYVNSTAFLSKSTIANTALWNKLLSFTITLRTKSKLSVAIEISIKFAQGTLPVSVISNVTSAPKSTCGKIAPLFNINGKSTILQSKQ